MCQKRQKWYGDTGNVGTPAESAHRCHLLHAAVYCLLAVDVDLDPKSRRGRFEVASLASSGLGSDDLIWRHSAEKYKRKSTKVTAQSKNEPGTY